VGVAKMKYFTIQWASGDLPDKESSEVVVKYWQNIEKIKGKIPDQVYFFANNINLHDGLIKKLIINDNLNIDLVVLCGDLPNGYEKITINYTNASILPKKMHYEDIFTGKSELLYDEIDISSDLIVHRFLIYPYMEFEIVFSGFSYSLIKVMDRI
jgi:hypothetical protein